MPIVTISRQFGSRGEEVGRALAEAMSYRYMDEEASLLAVAKKGNCWKKWTESFDHQHPGLWERYDWSFTGCRALLENVLLEEASRDNVVIMGRGGNMLLEGIPHALRVRITAPLESRVKRVMQEEAVDEAAAQRMVERRDRERASFVRSFYGKEWNDQDYYDIQMNVGDRQSIAEVVAALKNMLLKKEATRSGESKKLLRMRAAAASIKAHLALDSRLHVPTLDVRSDGTRIILQAVVHTPGERRLIESGARELSEGFPLRCALKYRCEGIFSKLPALRKDRNTHGNGLLRWIQRRWLVPVAGEIATVK